MYCLLQVLHFTFWGARLVPLYCGGDKYFLPLLHRVQVISMMAVDWLLSCLYLRFFARLVSNRFPPVALLFLVESRLTSRVVLEESLLDGSSRPSLSLPPGAQPTLVVSLITLRVVLEESWRSPC